MKAVKKLLTILPTIVKVAGIIAVLIESIEFFNTRLREKVGTMEAEELKTESNGENVSK